MSYFDRLAVMRENIAKSGNKYHDGDDGRFTTADNDGVKDGKSGSLQNDFSLKINDTDSEDVKARKEGFNRANENLKAQVAHSKKMAASASAAREKRLSDKGGKDPHAEDGAQMAFHMQNSQQMAEEGFGDSAAEMAKATALAAKIKAAGGNPNLYVPKRPNVTKSGNKYIEFIDSGKRWKHV